ncbi:hypothetical protein TWF718_001707 [Orbilia javanica]|uniref:Uncharacterized protein n=1 Tax=Orbilia javanica TaxID=47235 RepID=A0AAN8NA32_9PEZI
MENKGRIILRLDSRLLRAVEQMPAHPASNPMIAVIATAASAGPAGEQTPSPKGRRVRYNPTTGVPEEVGPTKSKAASNKVVIIGHGVETQGPSSSGSGSENCPLSASRRRAPSRKAAENLAQLQNAAKPKRVRKPTATKKGPANRRRKGSSAGKAQSKEIAEPASASTAADALLSPPPTLEAEVDDDETISASSSTLPAASQYEDSDDETLPASSPTSSAYMLPPQPGLVDKYVLTNEEHEYALNMLVISRLKMLQQCPGSPASIRNSLADLGIEKWLAERILQRVGFIDPVLFGALLSREYEKLLGALE